MNISYRVVLLAILLAAMTSCGSTIAVNPKASFPLSITDDAPAVMFPINIDYTGAPVESRKNGPAVTEAVVRQFGKKLVSSGQLFDAAGNLTFELPEAIDRSMRQGSWRLSGEQRAGAALDAFLRRAVNSLAAQRLVQKNYAVTYVLILHSRGRQAQAGSLSLESWGAVYNTVTGEIMSFKRVPATMPPTTGDAVAKLSEVYANMANDLLTGKARRQ